MENFWRAALSVGGVSAIAAALFWSLYKQWLTLTIFAQLTPNQTFGLMVLFLVFTALIVATMLYIYLVRPQGGQRLLLKGNVEFADGAPAQGAQVWVRGMNGFKETDRTGWFQFPVDDQSSWSVRASLADQNVDGVWTKAKINQSMVLKFPKKPVKQAIVTIGKDIRAQHWTQGAIGDPDRSRNVTSLYIPLKIENPLVDRDIVLRDIEIVDKQSGIAFEPPQLAHVPIDENRHEWLYQACHFARGAIFNGGQPTVVPKGNSVDTAIMIQDNNVHRPSYQLEIKFKDNQGENYHVGLSVPVKKYASWKSLSSDWPT